MGYHNRAYYLSYEMFFLGFRKKQFFINKIRSSNFRETVVCHNHVYYLSYFVILTCSQVFLFNMAMEQKTWHLHVFQEVECLTLGIFHFYVATIDISQLHCVAIKYNLQKDSTPFSSMKTTQHRIYFSKATLYFMQLTV